MLDATEAKASHGFRKYAGGAGGQHCGCVICGFAWWQGRFDAPESQRREGPAGQAKKGQGPKRPDLRSRLNCMIYDLHDLHDLRLEVQLAPPCFGELESGAVCAVCLPGLSLAPPLPAP